MIFSLNKVIFLKMCFLNHRFCPRILYAHVFNSSPHVFSFIFFFTVYLSGEQTQHHLLVYSSEFNGHQNHSSFRTRKEIRNCNSRRQRDLFAQGPIIASPDIESLNLSLLKHLLVSLYWLFYPSTEVNSYFPLTPPQSITYVLF